MEASPSSSAGPHFVPSKNHSETYWSHNTEYFIAAPHSWAPSCTYCIQTPTEQPRSAWTSVIKSKDLQLDEKRKAASPSISLHSSIKNWFHTGFQDLKDTQLQSEIPCAQCKHPAQEEWPHHRRKRTGIFHSSSLYCPLSMPAAAYGAGFDIIPSFKEFT